MLDAGAVIVVAVLLNLRLAFAFGGLVDWQLDGLVIVGHHA